MFRREKEQFMFLTGHPTLNRIYHSGAGYELQWASPVFEPVYDRVGHRRDLELTEGASTIWSLHIHRLRAAMAAKLGRASARLRTEGEAGKVDKVFWWSGLS